MVLVFTEIEKKEWLIEIIADSEREPSKNENT